MSSRKTSVNQRFGVVDLFCGTGGISYGLALGDQRFSLIAGVDNDEAAAATAAKNHPGALILSRDVAEIDPKALVRDAGWSGANLIVGGPPCQGFTSLRPSRGTTLDDPRNHLYREFQRFVEQLRPPVFLLENVIGLVNATRGELLEDLIAGFRALGYRTDWRVLNAANFGIPQKRERFFLMGVHESLGLDTVPFPVPSHAFSGRTIGLRDKTRHVEANASAPPALTAWDAISDLPSIPSGEASTRYASRPRNAFQRAMRSGARSLTLHTAAAHNAKMLEVIRHAGASKSALPEGLVTSGYSSCYSRIDPNEAAPTITVKFTSPASSKCIHPFDDRAITPREAARIQSFPDSFEFAGSKTEIAEQLGNAVPPLLAAAFAPVIAEILSAAR